MKSLFLFVLAIGVILAGLYFLQLFVMHVWLSATPSPDDLSALRMRAYISIGLSALCFVLAALLIWLGLRARRTQ